MSAHHRCSMSMCRVYCNDLNVHSELQKKIIILLHFISFSSISSYHIPFHHKALRHFTFSFISFYSALYYGLSILFDVAATPNLHSLVYVMAQMARGNRQAFAQRLAARTFLAFISVSAKLIASKVKPITGRASRTALNRVFCDNAMQSESYAGSIKEVYPSESGMRAHINVIFRRIFLYQHEQQIFPT